MRMQMNERLDIRYGPYRLVAASYKGRFQAVAFLGRQETLRVGGESLVEAMADLQVKIEANRAAMVAARGDGEPSEQEYATAVQGQRSVVRGLGYTLLLRHARMPGYRASIDELARACQADPEDGDKAYTQLSRALGDALAYRPRDEISLRHRPLLSICTLDKTGAGQAHIWVMRENLARALAVNLQIQ
jgi:hypothetical protein